MALEILPALHILKHAFPEDNQLLTDDEFGEISTYRGDLKQGYAREHRELFEPIEKLYELIRKISLAINHIAGAVG